MSETQESVGLVGTTGVAQQSSAQVQAIRVAMNASFKERTSEIDVLMTALLANEMCFLIGPPGTAKSLICETLCKSIGGEYFSWLVSKFTTPDEIFGSPSIEGLKQNRFERVTKNKLPEAHVAFLDEVFKGSSAILNTLLPVINERKFYNGATPTKIPLRVLFGASNEIPEAVELGALYDRFTLRVQVNYLKKDSSLEDLLMSTSMGSVPSITMEQLELEQQGVQAVQFSQNMAKLLVTLRNLAAAEGIEISDRKMKKSVGVLKAYSYLNGRQEVCEEDLVILENVFWDTPDQIKTLKRIINKVSNPIGEQLMKITDSVQEVFEGLEKNTIDPSSGIKKVKAAIQSLQKLGDVSKNPKLKKAIEEAQNTQRKIIKQFLDLED